MNEGVATLPAGERLRMLNQTAPDTAMGKLLRRFWQPVALANSVEAGKARAVRVMSEDLTLYPVHLMTRNSAGMITRKLSETVSRNVAQFRGTFSRRNPSVASAKSAQVA